MNENNISNHDHPRYSSVTVVLVTIIYLSLNLPTIGYLVAMEIGKVTLVYHGYTITTVFLVCVALNAALNPILYYAR